MGVAIDFVLPGKFLQALCVGVACLRWPTTSRHTYVHMDIESCGEEPPRQKKPHSQFRKYFMSQTLRDYCHGPQVDSRPGTVRSVLSGGRQTKGGRL